MAFPRNLGLKYDPALLARLPDAPTFAPTAAAPPTPEELRALVRTMDFTTLGGDDTPTSVAGFLAKAKTPVHGELPAAICVFPVFVHQALAALAGTRVRVATVAAAFPHGLSLLDDRVQEVETARELGAHEIDIVIQRAKALSGEWHDLYREIRRFRDAAGESRLKVILETGELGGPERVGRAALVAMMAGADFVKTSTGKTAVNATLESASAMLAAAVAYRDATGITVGFKAAGGIRKADDAVQYLRLAVAAMGPDYAAPDTFRIGASALMDDVASR